MSATAPHSTPAPVEADAAAKSVDADNTSDAVDAEASPPRSAATEATATDTTTTGASTDLSGGPKAAAAAAPAPPSTPGNGGASPPRPPPPAATSTAAGSSAADGSGDTAPSSASTERSDAASLPSSAALQPRPPPPRPAAAAAAAAAATTRVPPPPPTAATPPTPPTPPTPEPPSAADAGFVGAVASSPPPPPPPPPPDGAATAAVPSGAVASAGEAATPARYTARRVDDATPSDSGAGASPVSTAETAASGGSAGTALPPRSDAAADAPSQPAPAPAPPAGAAAAATATDGTGKRHRTKEEKKADRKAEKKAEKRLKAAAGGDAAAATASDDARPLLARSDDGPAFSLAPPAGGGGGGSGLSATPHARPMVPPLTSLLRGSLAISVFAMSPLRASVSVVHPLVRAWLVDAATGCSLAAPGSTGAGADSRPAPTSVVAYPYDLRLHESVAPRWDEELSLPLAVDAALHTPGAVLLFEVLDFGGADIRGRRMPYQDAFLVAWGFLRLQDADGRTLLGPTDDGSVDTSKDGRGRISPRAVSIGVPAQSTLAAGASRHGASPPPPLPPHAHTIQLFYPPQKGWIRKLALAALPRCLAPQASAAPASHAALREAATVPDIFHAFNSPLNRRDAYPGTLTVAARAVGPGYDPPPSNATPAEAALLDLFLHGNNADQRLLSQLSMSRVQSSKDRRARESQWTGYSYARHRGERALPPSVVVHKPPREKDRVTALALASTGALLAVAVVADFEACIKLFDVFTSTLACVGVLRGHADFVHSVAFSHDATLLLSCSSDKTARVWRVGQLPAVVSTSVDETQLTACVLPHGFYVYDGVFCERSAITVGYDPHLYVWSVATGRLAVRVPNAGSAFCRQIAVDQTSIKIWTLDDAGVLAVWRATIADGPTFGQKEVSEVSLRRRIDCRGAISMSVRHSLVLLHHPRDGRVTIVEASTYGVLHRVNGVPKDARGATLLPDGRAFVLGTPRGRFLAWDATTGEMLTAADGSRRAAVDFAIDRICWSTCDHLAVLVSDADESGACQIAVVGRPRREEETTMEADPSGAAIVRHMFGGDVALRGAAAQPVTAPTPRTGRDGAAGGPLLGRRTAARGMAVGDLAGDPLGGEVPMRDREKRMDQILRYWRTLVGSHSGASAAPASAATVVSAAAAARTPEGPPPVEGSATGVFSP